MKKLSILFAIFASSLALAVCSCAKKANDGGGKDNLPEISDLIIYENDVEAVLGDVLAIRATDGKNSVKCSWKSSDESIATVDEWGNVTAENVGNATITATYGKLSATCAVSVTLGGNLPSIETDADDNVTVDLMHEVGVGGEIRFNGKTVDGGKVTYTVVDEEIGKIEDGVFKPLKKGETIDKLLYGGYSTISLGYAGLYECVKYMTGKSHTSAEAKPFALSVMQHMNDKCKEWKAKENIDFSLYGTPLESTTYKFAKCLQKRFGVIEGVTDKNYITNSYHVHVTEKIDAFTKLKFESEFQQLSPGGAISYVEVPNMQNNIPAVLELMKYIYDNIMYAELNTKSDYCQVCGYDGEMQIVTDNDGKLVWECPNCHNRDQSKMNVARRTCGYIGTQFWNQGRTQEIKERVLHL